MDVARFRTVKQRREAKAPKYVDYGLILIVLLLVAFGLVMLYSTSTYEGLMLMGDSSYYFKHQLFAIIAGIGVMAGMMYVPYRFWKKISPIVWLAASGLIVAVRFFGYSANGAKRWIRIFGFSVQPAEVAKFAVIIFTSTLIVYFGRRITGWRNALKTLGAATADAFLVLIITRNLSSAVIIMAIAIIMIFVATPSYRVYVLAAVVLFAFAAITVFLISKAEYDDSLNFRFARVLAWLDPKAYASGKGFQILQSLYAIGSGGVMGKGLGESMQKMGYIPEAQNDMIFSIICEELGLFGAFAIMLLFVLLIWELVRIANSARDLYGSMVVIGVIAHISIQVILNIAVVTNTIPNTGITLPFVSYGGSAVMLQLAEIGLALSVARDIDIF